MKAPMINTYQRCLPTYKNSHDLAKETEMKNVIAMKTQIVTLEVKTKLQKLTLKKNHQNLFYLASRGLRGGSDAINDQILLSRSYNGKKY